MKEREYFFYTLIAFIFLFSIGYILYQSIFLSFLLTPLAFLYPQYKRKEIIKNRRLLLLNQFKEAMYVIASSLSAGKSLEGSIKDALKDMMAIYDDPETLILKELAIIVKRLELNDTVESAIVDLAERSKLEDIRNFADVIIICKRTGGNLIEVMSNTSKIIGEKIAFTQELNLILAQRKFDQKILTIMPFILIVLLSYITQDYMEPIFTTVVGRIVMTIAFFMIMLAVIISKKIMEIEV
ncbi:pilus assembly protein TadB [Alkaliphilus pronyensis]|uniref:Pilus assembly protein TadB n=2 Tax=Alkaliphilus pronyensis TaxID=1482732 RepID=A0A6I0FDS0_9FIRM|nr:pilus assembly protein TadB [Alkaliphilus pronyensis]